MQLRQRQQKLKDLVKTKNQLINLKRKLIPIFEEMGISASKMISLHIRLGQEWEFDKNCKAFYNETQDEIVIRKGLNLATTAVLIAHEVGHKITKFGTFGIFGLRRQNFIGEISAFNFEMRFVKVINKHIGEAHIIVSNEKFIKAMKSSPVHYFSFKLNKIPLGSLIKKEYK